jgi:hypothetical protein
MWEIAAITCAFIAGRFVWKVIYKNGDTLEVDRETAERLKKELDQPKNN